MDEYLFEKNPVLMVNKERPLSPGEFLSLQTENLYYFLEGNIQ